MDRTDQELIAKHLAEASGRALADEVATFESLPAPAQATVLERLKVIDALLSLSRAAREDVEKAAAKVGMGRANLYRLIARMKADGPVIGLAPRAQVKPVASAPKQGLPPTAEKAVRDVLAQKPDAPLLDVLEAIEKAYARSRRRPPSIATIQRRIAVLRQPGNLIDVAAWKSKRAFGRKVLLDQCAVASKRHGVDANLVISFIIDIETRLIIGCGQAALDRQSRGLRAAIEHARSWAAGFVVGRFNVEVAPDDIRWVVPDDMLGANDAWEQWAVSGDTRVAFYLGPRRHGEQLSRLIGSEFGAFKLMPRLTGQGLWREGAVEIPPPDLSDHIRAAAADWNYRVLEAASGSAPTSDPLERHERLDGWRALQSADAVKALVETVVGPVEDAINVRSRLPQAAS